MQANIMYSELLPDLKFSREEIDDQLQKIFADPRFIGSDILKRFLTFIVDETLMGHSDWLKEYTIGVKVLNKPIDFKPQECGIVRIHAGRLRRALHHYYQQSGTNDSIFISIPKGGYVPIFSKNIETAEENNEEKMLSHKPASIAVLPFNQLNNRLSDSFAHGLCLQISNGLMRFENFSVIAYHIARNLFDQNNGIKDMTPVLDVQFVIAGNIQYTTDRIRINVEMIELNTSRQIWNYMYESKFNEVNSFELQDTITKGILSELGEFCNVKKVKPGKNILAIA